MKIFGVICACLICSDAQAGVRFLIVEPQSVRFQAVAPAVSPAVDGEVRVRTRTVRRPVRAYRYETVTTTVVKSATCACGCGRVGCNCGN